MKKVLLYSVLIIALSSCKNYKNDLCSGQWVLIEKWNLSEKQSFKPSKQKIRIAFNADGGFDYYDSTKKVGYANTFTLKGEKLNLHFVGLSNELDAKYRITKADSVFLHMDTSPNFKNDYEATHYVFVKQNSGVASTYEGLD